MGRANLLAANRTIKKLELDGSLANVPDALVELCRSAARAVDSEPGNAALLREYRAALTDLRLTASASVDDDATDFLISIQTPRGRAAVVDAADA
jgi:hypothetical protein